MQSIAKTLLCFLLILPFGAFGHLEWKSRPSLPEFGADLAASFTANGKVYFCCGRRADGSYSKDLWEFDPATNIWEQKADYPGNGSNQCISFSIENRGYVGMREGFVAGTSTTARYADFYEYNPLTDVWSTKANFPGGINYSSPSFVIGDTAYVVGGSCGGTTCYKDFMYMYVPSTNRWTRREDYPGGKRATMTAFSIGQNGFVGHGVSSSHTLSNNFWQYNPTTNTWTSIASYPGKSRHATTSFTKNGLGYVGCGSFNYYNRVYQNSFYTYNPSTNSWTRFSSNSDFLPRLVTQTRAINDSSILVMGGRGDYGVLADVWQLNVDPDSCTSFDTVTIIEQRFIDVYDTTQVFDTSYTVITDTIEYYDTLTQTIFDTITVYKLDTTQVFVIDTFYRILFDTTAITVYDTIYNYIDIVVEDTLNFTLYQEGCGNISFQLYPNPTSEFVNFYTDKPDCFPGARVDLVSELGQVISSKPFSPLVSFDMRGLARAMYLIRLVHANGTTVISKKVVVK